MSKFVSGNTPAPTLEDLLDAIECCRYQFDEIALRTSMTIQALERKVEQHLAARREPAQRVSVIHAPLGGR